MAPGRLETERVLLNALTEIFILRLLRNAGSPLTILQVSRRAGTRIFETADVLEALRGKGVVERAPDAGPAWRYQATPRPSAEAGDVAVAGERGEEKDA